MLRDQQTLQGMTQGQAAKSLVAQAAKPADEAKPRQVREKTNIRRRAAGKAGLAACATYTLRNITFNL
jgi:hypothetical protein